MIKQRAIDISETNCALLGSDLEKQVKKAAAETEEQWKGVGKAPGLKIWRIEKFKVVPWPEEEYGNFFSGDSYIVLHTYKKSEDSDALSHDVHFWLGLETSQDEAGTAAYKTVELDDVLGGVPVQHREVQGYESELFFTYFKAIKIQSGGVDTGFKHVEPAKYRSRLMQVKGVKENVVMREVPLSKDSLNSGDVFTLDAGLNFYIFSGSKANSFEKIKATELSGAINSERGGKVNVVQFNEGEEPKEFWDLLGGKGPIGASKEEDSAVSSNKRLMRISDFETQGKDYVAPLGIKTTSTPEPVLKSGTFNADQDAAALKKAFGFFSTKEDVLIEILGSRTFEQRKQIAEAYAKLGGKPLLTKLESKTSFNLKKTFVALFTEQSVIDARALRSAMKGAGTDEKTLIEILCFRNNQQINDIKAAYKKEFNRELDADVVSETSGDFKKVLVEILKAVREEGTQVDATKAEEDARILFKAGEDKWGTDEDKFIEVLTHRSLSQLAKTVEAYTKVGKYTLLEAVHRETSGDFRDGLMSLVRSAVDKEGYFQERLYRAMKGAGTDDDTLIRVIVSRSEIDLMSIKRAFNEAHPETTLAHMIAGDTSGNYKKLLLKLIGETEPQPLPPKQPKKNASTQPLARMVEVSQGRISKSLLSSDDVFVLDADFEVFVWVGKNASRVEKKTALQLAQDYLATYKRPIYMPISRILEGGENPLFLKCFDD